MIESIERMRLNALEKLVREEQLNTMIDVCQSKDHKFEMKGFDEYYRELLRIPMPDMSLFTQQRCLDKSQNELHNYDNNFNVLNLGPCYQSIEELQYAVQSNFSC